MFISHLATTSFAQTPSGDLTRRELEIFPDGPIGGGLTHYGENVVSKAEDQNKPVIHFTQVKGKGHWAIRWFPNHNPLKLQTLSSTQNLQLNIQLRAHADITTTVTVDWKMDQRSPGRLAVKSQPIKLAANQWTEVIMPIPPAEPDSVLKGLYIQTNTPGEYDIRSIHIISTSSIELQPIARDALFNSKQTLITGKAADNVKQIQLTVQADEADGKHIAINQTLPVNANGQFQYTLQADQLQAGKLYHIQCQPEGDTQNIISMPIFAYYQFTDKLLAPVTVKQGKLSVNDQPFAFVGTNYTKFQLGLSNRSDFEMLNRHLLELKDWGIHAIRIPINFGLIQVAPGVFPDDPQWATIIKDHKLDPRFFEALEYCIKMAGELGIYSIIDWHGYANNPYRYFLGGMPSDREKGKPGKAIAWLAPDDKTSVPYDWANPMHRKALLDSHDWIARHFKGNPNIMGIEVPFNEPHDAYAAVESNWREMTAACSLAVKLADPDRLTFMMGSSYSHDNATAAGTWLKPDLADGSGNHFYFANGPVALRPEASKYKHPWLVRDVDESFMVATSAVLLPFSTQSYPQYNGEDGDHGFSDLLADMEPTQAAQQMIEAGMFRNWASGQAGWVLWTMHQTKHFTMFHDVYAKLFKKYSPLYAAGPVDWSQSDLLFIQNPAADQIANGHNHSCVPIARMMLNLHLDPAHYMTDDQFLTVGVARYAKGLEQVQEGARDLSYKAVVLDSRNCDQRVIKMVSKMKIPTLITEDIRKVSNEQMIKFLSDAGIATDIKTPQALHWATGPEHVVLYNHTGEKVTANAFPRVKRDSQFKLVTTDGNTLFTGTSSQLRSDGIAVSIEPRTALILQIQ
jgi:hypothetical protein